MRTLKEIADEVTVIHNELKILEENNAPIKDKIAEILTKTRELHAELYEMWRFMP